MFLDPLSQATEPSLVSGATTAGTSAITSSTYAAGRAEQVRFLASLAAVTDTCVLTMKAQGGYLSDGSDAVDIAGCATSSITTDSAATTATTNVTPAPTANKFLSLDVVRSPYPYLRVVLTRTTANAAVNFILAEGYNFKNIPITSSNLAATKVAQG